MEKSIELLNKALSEWKRLYEDEKIYYAGSELQGRKACPACVEYIKDLEEAINVLLKADEIK